VSLVLPLQAVEKYQIAPDLGMRLWGRVTTLQNCIQIKYIKLN